MSSHTPGPWLAACDCDDIDEPNGIYARIGRHRVKIAEVVDADEIRSRHNRGRVERPGSTAGPDALDEADANARLIAAAPDLLAAVLALRQFADDSTRKVIDRVLSGLVT